MSQQTLHEIFTNFAKKDVGVFKDRAVLGPDYIPDNTMHRDEEIKQLAKIVAPAVRGGRISNVFVYGNTGTGKTLVAKHVTSELAKTANIGVVYVNCKMKRVSDTEYRLLAALSRELGKPVPPTGLPTEEVYKIFYSALSAAKKNTIFILDEIDALVKKIGDDILYNLLRIGQQMPGINLSMIGISNDISFVETLDPRVKSSLSEEEMIFPPYNATQLQDILIQRSAAAFSPGAIGPGVIAKCAALAAQEHGDARRAIDLLRMAGELAEREGATHVEVKHIDKADDKLDLDRYVELVRSHPKQSKAVLAAAIQQFEQRGRDVQTGDIFTSYEKIAQKNNLKLLTQRRVSDLIAELDMQGILNTRVISKGRYGRTREIRILLSAPILVKIKKVLETSLAS